MGREGERHPALVAAVVVPIALAVAALLVDVATVTCEGSTCRIDYVRVWTNEERIQEMHDVVGARVVPGHTRRVRRLELVTKGGRGEVVGGDLYGLDRPDAIAAEYNAFRAAGAGTFRRSFGWSGVAMTGLWWGALSIPVVLSVRAHRRRRS
jgi:hypothetical protein